MHTDPGRLRVVVRSKRFDPLTVAFVKAWICDDSELQIPICGLPAFNACLNLLTGSSIYCSRWSLCEWVKGKIREGVKA